MIRKAIINDTQQIHKLINHFADKELVIARSLNEIFENIRDFWVFENNKKIEGCARLHIVGWEGLAEIKSLAVNKNSQKKGVGKQLINYCLNEAKELKIKKVFALTYIPNFFRKFGFKKISKNKLPHKIWAECCHCPKFPDCNEEAVIIDLKR